MKLLGEKPVNYVIRRFSGSMEQLLGCNNYHAITDTFNVVANPLLNFPGLFVQGKRFIGYFSGFTVPLLWL